jgi:F-type H+-transporting ATPase subunit alpha
VEVAHQVCIIFAVTNGYLKDIPVEAVHEFELRLQEFMDNRHADVLEAIRTTGKLEADTADKLKDAINELLAEFRPAV